MPTPSIPTDQQTESQIDPDKFRHILGHYPTGVCVITSLAPDGAPVALVVSSFTSVSLDPPLVGFFPARRSTSWPKIEASGHFMVNILAHGQLDMCRQLASPASKTFENIPYEMSASGLPILRGVVAHIDCQLHAVHEAGDHFLVLGEVRALDIRQPETPLIFFQGRYGTFDS